MPLCETRKHSAQRHGLPRRRKDRLLAMTEAKSMHYAQTLRCRIGLKANWETLCCRVVPEGACYDHLRNAGVQGVQLSNPHLGGVVQKRGRHRPLSGPRRGGGPLTKTNSFSLHRDHVRQKTGSKIPNSSKERPMARGALLLCKAWRRLRTPHRCPVTSDRCCRYYHLPSMPPWPPYPPRCPQPGPPLP